MKLSTLFGAFFGAFAAKFLFSIAESAKNSAKMGSRVRFFRFFDRFFAFFDRFCIEKCGFLHLNGFFFSVFWRRKKFIKFWGKKKKKRELEK
jgi:hypothetical protein